MPYTARTVYIGKDRMGYIYVKEYASSFTKKAFVYIKANSRAPLRYLGALSESILRLFSAKIRQALQRYLPQSGLKNAKMAIMEFLEALDSVLHGTQIAQRLVAEWNKIKKKYGVEGTPYEVLEQLIDV